MPAPSIVYEKPFQGEFVALAIKRALEAYTLRRYRMDMHLFLQKSWRRARLNWRACSGDGQRD